MSRKLDAGRLTRKARKAIARGIAENLGPIGAWFGVAVLAALAAFQLLPEDGEESLPETVDSVVLLGVNGHIARGANRGPNNLRGDSVTDNI